MRSIAELLQRDIDLGKRGLVLRSGVYIHPAPREDTLYAPADCELVSTGWLDCMAQDTPAGCRFVLKELLNGVTITLHSPSSRLYFIALQIRLGGWYGVCVPASL